MGSTQMSGYHTSELTEFDSDGDKPAASGQLLVAVAVEGRLGSLPWFASWHFVAFGPPFRCSLSLDLMP